MIYYSCGHTRLRDHTCHISKFWSQIDVNWWNFRIQQNPKRISLHELAFTFIWKEFNEMKTVSEWLTLGFTFNHLIQKHSHCSTNGVRLGQDYTFVGDRGSVQETCSETVIFSFIWWHNKFVIYSFAYINTSSLSERWNGWNKCEWISFLKRLNYFIKIDY